MNCELECAIELFEFWIWRPPELQSVAHGCLHVCAVAPSGHDLRSQTPGIVQEKDRRNMRDTVTIISVVDARKTASPRALLD